MNSPDPQGDLLISAPKSPELLRLHGLMGRSSTLDGPDHRHSRRILIFWGDQTTQMGMIRLDDWYFPIENGEIPASYVSLPVYQTVVGDDILLANSCKMCQCQKNGRFGWIGFFQDHLRYFQARNGSPATVFSSSNKPAKERSKYAHLVHYQNMHTRPRRFFFALKTRQQQKSIQWTTISGSIPQKKRFDVWSKISQITSNNSDFHSTQQLFETLHEVGIHTVTSCGTQERDAPLHCRCWVQLNDLPGGSPSCRIQRHRFKRKGSSSSPIIFEGPNGWFRCSFSK